ncbi:hypothetical protein M426DRAFT_316777 [Hypoxylon sp. CI-4A]|nr:hypothetical protein M426DRAFT_316777 [Hypoxylon sp. CI-4A]
MADLEKLDDLLDPGGFFLLPVCAGTLTGQNGFLGVAPYKSRLIIEVKEKNR